MNKTRICMAWGFFALCLFFSSCRATGSQSEPSSDESQAKPVSISWAMWVDGEVSDVREVSARLTEQMPGVSLDFILIDKSMWHSQMNAMIAGGGIPDLISQDEQWEVASLAAQDIICEIPVSLIEKNAPGIFKAIAPYAPLVWLATGVDGKNYGVPMAQPDEVAPVCNQWRMDMLRKMGIDKVPETLEEAEIAFDKAIQLDLNGSGKNDTYGLSFRGKDLTEHLFSTVFAAFGTLPGKWMLNDGALTLGIMKDEAKDALERLAVWYQKGYIDPGFVTTDVTTFRQKVVNGNILMICFSKPQSILPPDGEYLKLAQSKNPKAELVPGPPLKGPDGKSGYDTWPVGTASVTFSKAAKEDGEKLLKCLQVVDFLCADSEEALSVLFGQKGVEWEQDKQTNAFLSLTTPAGEIEQRVGYYVIPVPERQARFRHNLLDAYSVFNREGSIKPQRDYIDWAGSYADPEIYAAKTEADREFQKSIIDIIIGDLPSEAFWEVRKKWYDQGGRWVTEEINRAYREEKDSLGKHVYG